MEPLKKCRKTGSVIINWISILPIGPLLRTMEYTTVLQGTTLIFSAYVASLPQLNMLARVCREWHITLAPPDGACAPKLTRRVTLSQADMFTVAAKGTIARPWWRWVKAKNDLTDAGLACLVVACPDMEILDLFSCYRITDTGLAILAAVCPRLRKLNLGHCNQITDTGLASLATGCPAITDLYLGHCDHMTDTGLASLRTGCPAITVLYLRGCYRITKDAITAWRHQL
jgi:hypothetical protein